MNNTISAVFENRSDAESAVSWLRQNGVPDDAISLIGRGEGTEGAAATNADGEGRERAADASDAGKGALAGLGVGAGVGALFGLAALAIPGAGPFITAGALAHALGVTGGAIASGAIVGGTAGGVAGALSHYGLNEAESKYYAGEVERGGTWVGVDLNQTDINRETITDTFRRFNGRFADSDSMQRAA